MGAFHHVRPAATIRARDPDQTFEKPFGLSESVRPRLVADPGFRGLGAAPAALASPPELEVASERPVSRRFRG